MKKLLSLLSVLTISGSAVPTTVAASSYQKEEIIKNSDINYQETNNLEKLTRNKRDGGTDNIGDPVKKDVIDPVNKVGTDNIGDPVKKDVIDPVKKITQNCLDNMGNMGKNTVKRIFKATGVENTILEGAKGPVEVCIKANSDILD